MKRTFKNIIKNMFSLISTNEDKHILKSFDSLGSDHILTLIDIGAAGDIQPRWKKIASHLNYVGFEPDKRSFDDVNSKKLGTKHKIIFPVALWSSNEEQKIHLCRKPQVSSIYEPNHKLLNCYPMPERFEVDNIEKIQPKKLDDLKITSCDFIKLDVQGAELDILHGATKSLDKCIGLELEVEFLELYKNQSLFGDVCKFLNSKGIDFIDFVHISRWERDLHSTVGQAMFGDALFLRTPEWIANNGSNERISSYLKVCLLYRRFDLIRSLLSQLPTEKKDSLKNFISSIKKLEKRFRLATKLSRYFSYVIYSINGRQMKLHLTY